MAVFPPQLFKDVLWCNEAVQHKLPKPVRDVRYEVVMFFFVHGGQYLIEFCADGELVALAPVEKHVVASNGGVEVVWTSHGHDR